MEITFDFDVNDWSKFQQHHMYRSKILRITTYVMTIFLLFFCVLILLGFLLKTSSAGDLLKNTLPFLIFTAVYLYFIKNRGRSRFSKRIMIKEKNNPQVLGQRTMRFEDDFYIVKTVNSESKSSWDAIKNIDETPEYFYLYLSKFTAHVIPKNKINVNIEDLQTLLKSHVSQQNYKFYKK